MIESPKKIKVLVSEGGSVNALAIVRHLGGLPEFQLFVVAYNNLALSRYSKYCHHFTLIPHPKKDSGGFQSAIIQIIKENQIDYFMPVGFYAHKVSIDHSEELSLLTKTILPGKHAFEIATSKIETGKLAESLGVLVPKTLTISNLNQLETIGDLNYPVVVKSQKEIGGRMVEYAHSHKELVSVFRSMVSEHGLVPDNYPIIQEYIAGKGVGFFAFYKNGVLQRSFMHERVREFPVSGGRSVCARSFTDEKLFKSGKLLLDSLKWNGCAMVEYKKTATNNYYLLEINPKLWGSIELAMCCGVNFPLLMVQDALELPAEAAAPYPNDFYFQWCLNGELYYLANRPLSVLSIFKTLFYSKKDFWIKDIKPNLMQGMLVWVDLYKVIKKKYRVVKIDFHTHTYFSYDCLMRPEKILSLADANGLSHIVVNDHNTISGGLACKAIEKNYKVKVIVGSEIKTDIGDVTGIFLKEEIPPGPYLEVIENIKRQNGLSILNHPFVGHRLEGLNFEVFDLIEGYNGRCNPDQNAKAIDLALRYNKPYIAGSDSHTYGEIGKNYSEFLDISDLKKPVHHVYKKSHNANKVLSQLIKGYKKGDLWHVTKVLLAAPKKIILNR